MSYLWIKHLHMAAAGLSIVGFLLRGSIKIGGGTLPRWTKIAPHCIDTILLGCAIYLCIHSGQHPGNSPWLAAKLIALLGYIGFGMVVLRFADNNRQRIPAFIAAIACFGYIVLVASSRQVLPVF